MRFAFPFYALIGFKASISLLVTLFQIHCSDFVTGGPVF